MTEPVIIGLCAAGGILWAAGGTWWKGWRRFLWPTVVAGGLLFSGIAWPVSLGCAAAVMISTLLPYGDLTPTPVRWLVILAHNLPCLVINLWAFPVALVAAALSIGLFQASKKWNFVTHKLFEFFSGFAQGACIVVAVLMS